MAQGVTSRAKTTSTGRPNVEKLINQGRLKGFDNPFDPNPNPERGHTMDPKTGMRVGLDPITYLTYVKKDLENDKRPASAPNLTPEEKKVMDAFAKEPKGIPADLKEALAAYLGQ